MARKLAELVEIFRQRRDASKIEPLIEEVVQGVLKFNSSMLPGYRAYLGNGVPSDCSVAAISAYQIETGGFNVRLRVYYCGQEGS